MSKKGKKLDIAQAIEKVADEKPVVPVEIENKKTIKTEEPMDRKFGKWSK